MKKLILLLMLALIGLSANALTNVSGGIYSNTTWTLINSPYIVTDTVVVFPNVTLTIEPGVVVKFYDHKYIEVRNATIIANGNAVDSITFTSNSNNPTPGIWGATNYGGIYLNSALAGVSFNFINMKYATVGIYNGLPVFIKNSTFIYNQTGLNNISAPIDSCIFEFNTYGINSIDQSLISNCTFSNNTCGIGYLTSLTLVNCVVDSNGTGLGGNNGMDMVKIYNCTINYNQAGLIPDPCCGGGIIMKNCIIDNNSNYGLGLAGDGEPDSIVNCEFKYNGIGLISSSCPNGFGNNYGIITQCIIDSNSIGIKVSGCMNIYCNKICNNTTYDLQNLMSSPRSLPNNYWCSTDSATIHSHIDDGYTNINLGLVSVFPIDSVECYLNINTGINSPATNSNSIISLYPNPTSGNFTITYHLNNNPKASFQIIDVTGRIVYTTAISGTEGTQMISVPDLSNGIYYWEMITNNGIEGKGKIAVIKD